jgi:hypothetical protein
MESALFEDLSVSRGSSGVTRGASGLFRVYCDVIPEDAPQDWKMGPAQTPGLFGAYRAHGFYERGHGPYAFAVAKTPEDAKAAAKGFFKQQVMPFSLVTDQELERFRREGEPKA